MESPPHKAAFTLVELSLVLVIIGLLVGGILVGQSMIRSAEILGVASEYQRYYTSLQTFRDKYSAMPGDMRKATDFWGKDDTNCPTDTGTANIPGTCNGNGNGDFEFAAVAGGTAETFQFWKQLALAKLIEGSYSGLAGPGSVLEPLVGINLPTSKLGTGAGWMLSVNHNFPGSPWSYKYNYGAYLFLGKPKLATADQALFTPVEAWSLDTKLDDGKPTSGRVMAMYWNNQCTAADDGSSAFDDLVAHYRLDDNELLPKI